jgi:hypothetical protein
VKLTVFGSPHERCGISEYGRALNEAFEMLGVELELHSVRDMSALVHAKDNVLVHFEPSLITPTFYRVLTNVRRRGAKTVVCCHYFDETVGKALGPGAFKIAIHRDYRIPHPNTVIIPLGCPLYDYEGRVQAREDIFKELVKERPELDDDGEEQPTIITTCGFVSAWKRFPETVEALAPLLPPDTWLQMLCPYHFVRNEKEEQRLKAVAFKHERVILESEFIPEVEFLDRLAISDIGFVYHGENTSSVSAATKAFVSARCPFVVTDSNHASDISSAIHSVRKLSEFASTVVKTSKDFVRLREAKALVQIEYEHLNMIEIAGRYLDLYE